MPCRTRPTGAARRCPPYLGGKPRAAVKSTEWAVHRGTARPLSARARLHRLEQVRVEAAHRQLLAAPAQRRCSLPASSRMHAVDGRRAHDACRGAPARTVAHPAAAAAPSAACGSGTRCFAVEHAHVLVGGLEVQHLVDRHHADAACPRWPGSPSAGGWAARRRRRRRSSWRSCSSVASRSPPRRPARCASSCCSLSTVFCSRAGCTGLST